MEGPGHFLPHPDAGCALIVKKIKAGRIPSVATSCPESTDHKGFQRFSPGKTAESLTRCGFPVIPDAFEVHIFFCRSEKASKFAAVNNTIKISKHEQSRTDRQGI